MSCDGRRFCFAGQLSDGMESKKADGHQHSDRAQSDNSGEYEFRRILTPANTAGQIFRAGLNGKR